MQEWSPYMHVYKHPANNNPSPKQTSHTYRTGGLRTTEYGAPETPNIKRGLAAPGLEIFGGPESLNHGAGHENAE
jgi:hypothetical protein